MLASRAFRLVLRSTGWQIWYSLDLGLASKTPTRQSICRAPAFSAYCRNDSLISCLHARRKFSDQVSVPNNCSVQTQMVVNETKPRFAVDSAVCSLVLTACLTSTIFRVNPCVNGFNCSCG
jgi:hypothetical protein